MKHFLLIIIKIYWKLIPASKRKKCIFHNSCSNYVFGITKRHGLLTGLRAFEFRYKNCRSNYDIFIDPILGKRKMLLPNGRIVNENQIAERLITSGKVCISMARV